MGPDSAVERHAPHARRPTLVVGGVDAGELVRVTGGRARIGPAVGDGTAVLVEEHGGAAVLRREDEDDASAGSLDMLEGPVVLWWPDDRGRWEVDGQATRGAAGSVALRWPPRHAQQREHLRARLTTDAWVTELLAGGAATGTVLDLSAGGASIVVSDPPPWWTTGALVAVCLGVDATSVVAAGTVVRLGSNGRLGAVRFDAIAATDEDRITATVLAADSRRAAR